MGSERDCGGTPHQAAEMKRPRTVSIAGWMCAKGCRPDGHARTAAAAHVLKRAIREKMTTRKAAQALTFWHEHFVSVRRFHCETLGSRCVTGREPASGCSDDKNSVRVELGDVCPEVMIQSATSGVGVFDTCTGMAKLLNGRCRASLTGHKNGGKTGGRIAIVEHRFHVMHQRICCCSCARQR